MRITIYLFLFFAFISKGYSQKDSLNIEVIRTQSGVDPTRVNTKIAYSIWYFDKSANRSLINNRINFTAGINKWSLSLKYETATVNNGIPEEGFSTKSGNLLFSVLNAFYVKGKNALAAGLEFIIPAAPQGFGSRYFSVNPSVTYAYTINPSLILAFQPQYAFHIAKDTAFPDLSVLTIRTFIAKFQKTGWFYVFEPRIIWDFANDEFNMILSPIVGTSLGKGFNLGLLMELPTKQETIDMRGVLIQTGITKNF